MGRPFALTLILTALLAACSGELVPTAPAGGGGGGGGGGGDDTEARAVWQTDVLPLMTQSRPKGTCVGCHQGTAPTGPAFLGAAAADNFDTLTMGALIADSPAASRFMTIGEHTGNGFCTGTNLPVVGCPANEMAIVSNWITIVNTP